MRIIITGGTGQIGRALVQDLVPEGHEVIVLSRTPALVKGLPPKVRVEGWDAKTATGWGHLADGADAIINLAGANISGEGFFPARWTESKKQALIQSRVDAGRAVVEAVEQASEKPQVVVQQGAVGYYGSHPMDVLLTEDSPPGTDFLAHTQVEAERSTEAVEAMGVRRIITRCGAVLSFNAGALLRMALPFKLFVGGHFGSGQQPFACVHPADVVGTMKFLIRQPEASGPFNVVMPNVPTNASFSQALGQVMRRPSFMWVPGLALKIPFGEVSEVVLEGQNVQPARLLEMGYSFQFPDAQSALRDLYQSEVTGASRSA